MYVSIPILIIGRYFNIVIISKQTYQKSKNFKLILYIHNNCIIYKYIFFYALIVGIIIIVSNNFNYFKSCLIRILYSLY